MAVRAPIHLTRLAHARRAVRTVAVALLASAAASVPAAPPADTSPAGHPSRSGAAMACKRFSFQGEVHPGAHFTRSIGPQLAFSVQPQGDDGWTLEVGTTTPKRESELNYIYLLTPPWRGRHPIYLAPGYGESAQDVPLESNFFFLLRPRDADRAAYQLRQLIFSGASQPEEVSLDNLARLPMGWGHFKAFEADIQPGRWQRGEPTPPEFEQGGVVDDATRLELTGAIRALRFIVTLTVPQDHPLPAGTLARPSACGEPWPYAPAAKSRATGPTR